MDRLDILVSLETNLREQRRLVSKQLSRAPEGRLYVVKNGIYRAFRREIYIDGVRRMIGIGKKPDVMTALAHKAFLTEKLRRLNIDIELLEMITASSLSLENNAVIDALHPSLQTLPDDMLIYGRRANSLDWPHPVNESLYPKEARLRIDPEDRFNWAAEPYLANTSFMEKKIYSNPRGVQCRSKSEGSVLGLYDDLRIPFHTDETIIMGGRLIAPDIIGCRADGCLIYHEHKGMSSEAYNSRNDYKDRVYKEFGIRQGVNLIYTFDRPDGSVNLPLIQEIIKDAYRL